MVEHDVGRDLKNMEEPIARDEEGEIDMEEFRKQRFPRGSLPVVNLGGKRDLINAFRNDPATYRPLNRVAEDIATGPWEFEDEDSPLAQMLKKPNPHMTFEELIYYLVVDRNLVGASFWEVKFDDRLYVWRYPPTVVNVHPDHHDYIGSFTVNGETFFPDQVFFSTRPNPAITLEGLGRAEPVEDMISVSIWITQWFRSRFKRGVAGMPSRVYHAQKDKGKSWIKRQKGLIKKQLGSKGGWQDIAVIPKDLEPLDEPDNRELSFRESYDQVSRIIADTFGVPPEILNLPNPARGDRDLDAVRRMYEDQTVKTEAKFIESDINKRFSDVGGRIHFNDDKLSGQKKHNLKVREQMIDEVTSGVRKPNEARERIVDLQDTVPWGDVWWANVGQRPATSPGHPANRAEQEMQQQKSKEEISDEELVEKLKEIKQSSNTDAELQSLILQLYEQQ